MDTKPPAALSQVEVPKSSKNNRIMFASRAALRAKRRVRIHPLLRTARRPESSSNYLRLKFPNEANPAVIGGLVGGGTVALIGYAYYHYSGAATVIRTVNETKSKLEATLKETTEKVPEPDEAIQWLRDTAMKYAGYVPGGKEYVNNAFDDIEAI